MEFGGRIGSHICLLPTLMMWVASEKDLAPFARERNTDLVQTCSTEGADDLQQSQLLPEAEASHQIRENGCWCPLQSMLAAKSHVNVFSGCP